MKKFDLDSASSRSLERVGFHKFTVQQLGLESGPPLSDNQTVHVIGSTDAQGFQCPRSPMSSAKISRRPL